MKNTNNLSFNFTQTINDKSENGMCVLEYPKKIWCKYSGTNKKTLVSNGKSLVIKTNNNNNYYIYPLAKTPLQYLLDKKYLISKIQELEPRIIDNKYLNFKIFENNNEINIFFDKKNLNLIGWQTEDIYQNLSITFISSIKINQKLDNNKFKLPKNN
ncbi:outer-membrane lipoprotein carrier protein LolA [Candidatus Pelagibacter sp.]|nr:outer-membrane lipoprotein carrier protein LolA [Candidatus Pelagibacter sp.]